MIYLARVSQQYQRHTSLNMGRCVLRQPFIDQYKKNSALSVTWKVHTKETLNCALLDLLSTIIDKTIYILVRLKMYAALKRSNKLLLRVNTTEIQSQNGLTQKLKNKMCLTKHENMCLAITIRHENCEIKQCKKGRAKISCEIPNPLYNL